MTIRKVTTPAVVPQAAAAKPAVAAPPAASPVSAPFSTSSFTAAATAAPAASSTAHVDSNDSDVNDFVNQAIDAFNSSSPLSDQAKDSAAGFLRDTLGLKYFTKSAGQQVLAKVAQYVKDNPDASLQDVQAQMQTFAIGARMLTGYLEKSLDKTLTHKSHLW